MKRIAAPTCLNCLKKSARIGGTVDDDTHKFCSLKCGCRYGMMFTEGKKWCPACADWTDGCCVHFQAFDGARDGR